jgi:4-hydroxyphenylacetate 3-monooxygenase
MGARSGNNYLSTLKKLGSGIWLGGERVRELTAHPAFASCARSLASLYDLQMERPEAMTFRTDDGGRSGMSLIQPASSDDLRKRGRMMKAWADFGCGFFSPTPDRANIVIAAMAATHRFFSESDARYDENVQGYHRQACHRDWCATQALVDPDVSAMRLRLVDRSNEGIVVSGTRMLAALAPMAEELLVLPAIRPDREAPDPAFALAFAVPCNSGGLSFICRPGSAQARSSFDHPLSARFDTMDCAAIFDHVTIPWERVFLCGDVARCDALYAETGVTGHLMHQRAILEAARVEFLLGLAGRVAEVGGASQRRRIHSRLPEMIGAMETIREHLRAAEAEAAPNRWGAFVPSRTALESGHHLFTRIYPRLLEIIRIDSSSAMLATPSRADFASTELRPTIDRSFAGADCDAEERARLYHLADEIAGGSFADRQLLRESLSLPEAAEEETSPAPPKLDLEPLIERVKTFLARPD